MEFTNESPYKFFKERDRFLCVLFSGAGISADCAAGFVLPGISGLPDIGSFVLSDAYCGRVPIPGSV